MGIHGRKTNIGNYWGPNIRREIRGDNVTEKMIRANQQHLTASGYFAWLYQSVEGNDLCSCVNAQSGGQSSDTKCWTCYGTARIGGYERHGFITQFFSSSNLDDLILVNVEQNLTRKPRRLRLKSNELSGTIKSEKFRVENPLQAPIDFRFNAYAFDSQNSTTLVEFAINDGSWQAIDELPKLKMHFGELRFRVTLTRSASTIQSPEFEIFRFNYQTNREAMLKVSRGAGARRKDRQNWGETETEGSLRFWIGPKPLIRAFLEPLNEDGSGVVSELARNSESNKKGIDPFFEILTGTRKGERYLILTVSRSEPLARLVSQRMTVRLLQVNEIFYKVF